MQCPASGSIPPQMDKSVFLRADLAGGCGMGLLEAERGRRMRRQLVGSCASSVSRTMRQ
jgi:hypothetical protein